MRQDEGHQQQQEEQQQQAEPCPFCGDESNGDPIGFLGEVAIYWCKSCKEQYVEESEK
jgi:hypothetical protein